VVYTDSRRGTINGGGFSPFSSFARSALVSGPSALFVVRLALTESCLVRAGFPYCSFSTNGKYQTTTGVRGMSWLEISRLTRATFAMVSGR
jgi:hypothetical protein